MRRKRLIAQLLPWNLGIILLAMLLLTVYANGVIHHAYRTHAGDGAADSGEALLRIGLAGVALAALAALASLFVTRRLTRPLEALSAAARQYADGEFSGRVPAPRTAELGALADAMNQMAGQIEQTLDTLRRQRSQAEAVFASMVEGVLAVDADECVIYVNDAARKLMRIAESAAIGRSIQEVVRNPDLQNLIGLGLAGQAGSPAIIAHDDRYIEAVCSVLRDAKDGPIGALVVLHDVTRLHKLERVRREFVANVSHELKTPITSIKGFVETLLDGAIDDPAQARRFLEIVGRQSNRMTAIIDDLLSLSRLEQDTERGDGALADQGVEGVLRPALEACQPKAEARNVTLALRVEDGLHARMNANLMEQAVINLIDNAIKYSASGGAVAVDAARENGSVRISVSDAGSGIAREHLDRIFERFYRVDKGRSREQGGTGLGLAIVKHIARTHGGGVDVESELGKGSRFHIRLPAA